MWSPSPARLLVSVLPLLGSALAFEFALQTSGSNNGISKCGTINVIWQGGVPPFHMVVVPAFDYPTNISLPSSAWSSDSQMGNYSWTVNYPAGTKLVAMMSDSTGEGSGGVTPLYTVTESAATCQLRSTETDFLFYLNSTSVNQCSPLQVSWDSKAVGSVRLLGVIPSGQPFMFTAQPGSTTWNWNANVAAGTSFILGAFDGGRTGIGGSSDLMTVGQGGAGCLDDSSPSSTPAATVPTMTRSAGKVPATGTGTATVGAGGGVKTVTAIATVIPEGSGRGLSTGAIVGIVVCSILALLALQGAIFWFCCRRQVSALISHRKDMRTKGIKSGEVDLGAEDGNSRSPMENYQEGGIFGTASNRQSSYGDMTDGGEGTISPFREYGRTSQSDLADGRGERAMSGYQAYGSDTLLMPPRAHGRTESFGSGLTLDLPMSTFDDFSISPTDSPPLGSRTNSGQGSAPSSTPAIPSAVAAPSRRPPPSKAQMAASLSLHSPDMDRMSQPYGGIMPSQSTPVGGLRRHEDAGPAVVRARQDVEDLPPLYRPEWETESRHRDSTGR